MVCEAWAAHASAAAHRPPATFIIIIIFIIITIVMTWWPWLMIIIIFINFSSSSLISSLSQLPSLGVGKNYRAFNLRATSELFMYFLSSFFFHKNWSIAPVKALNNLYPWHCWLVWHYYSCIKLWKGNCEMGSHNKARPWGSLVRICFFASDAFRIWYHCFALYWSDTCFGICYNFFILKVQVLCLVFSFSIFQYFFQYSFLFAFIFCLSSWKEKLCNNSSLMRMTHILMHETERQTRKHYHHHQYSSSSFWLSSSPSTSSSTSD